jgi:predicted RNA-binding protein YlqC (UPF0109 family)
MEELLIFILEKLAIHPDKISLDKSSEEGIVTYNISLDEEDKGKIIGKAGRNIKAIRQVLSVIARENNIRVFLKID